MMLFEPYRLVQTDAGDEKNRAFLSAQLKQHNNRMSPNHLYIRTHPPRPLELILYDTGGEIVGGLAATTYWDWLDIDDLWLHESLRGRGFGRRLLALAEAQAQARGCHHAYLTTYSFQARGFYEKSGYSVVGALEGYPPGETYYWMRKDF